LGVSTVTVGTEIGSGMGGAPFSPPVAGVILTPVTIPSSTAALVEIIGAVRIITLYIGKIEENLPIILAVIPDNIIVGVKCPLTPGTVKMPCHIDKTPGRIFTFKLV